MPSPGHLPGGRWFVRVFVSRLLLETPRPRCPPLSGVAELALVRGRGGGRLLSGFSSLIVNLCAVVVKCLNTSH